MTVGWRRGCGALFLAAGLVGLAGCSAAASPAAPSTSAAAPAPEDERASAAEVATGLKKIDQIATDLAAAGADTGKAGALDAQIEPQWAVVEGTVKANDEDTYLAFEDVFAVLEKAAEEGDAAASAKGAATVSSTVAAYLAKYPG